MIALYKAHSEATGKVSASNKIVNPPMTSKVATVSATGKDLDDGTQSPNEPSASDIAWFDQKINNLLAESTELAISSAPDDPEQRCGLQCEMVMADFDGNRWQCNRSCKKGTHHLGYTRHDCLTHPSPPPLPPRDQVKSKRKPEIWKQL